MGLPLPNPKKLAAQFRETYALIDTVGDDLTLELRNSAGGYDPPFTVKAKVSGFKLTDLVAGSSVRQGDLRAIIRSAALPAGMRRLEQKDRATWAGRPHAILNYDIATHAFAGEVMAVELWLRG
jgi:hypothetical protein